MNKTTFFLLIFLLGYQIQSINVPLCSGGAVRVTFRDSVKATSDDTTYATLCHDRKFLYVTWENIDQDIIANYNNCNDPLYHEDAVQIFIASPSSYPLHYFQIELSPKGTVWYSQQTNPSGNYSKFSGQPLDCNLIEASGKIVTGGWQAKIQVDLNIIFRKQSVNYVYANLFRIDYTRNQATKYLAMNPTLTPTPCFHVPSKFQKFVFLGLNQTHPSY